MDSTATIDQKKQTGPGFKWVMLIFCCLNMLTLNGLCMTTFTGIAGKYIIPELGWTTLDYALVWGAWPLAVAIFATFGGMLFEKTNYRYLQILSVLIGGGSVLMRAFVTGTAPFYLVIFAYGMSMALFRPGNIKVITAWFPRHQIYIANGFLMAASPIGSMTGLNLAEPLLLAVGGWRNMFIITGAIVMCFSLLWIFIAKDRSNQESELSKSLNVDTTEVSTWENLKVLFKTRHVWMCCLSDFFFSGVILTYMGFAPQVFLSWSGMTVANANFTASMANLGSLFGYMILPSISEKFGIRKPFIIAGTGLTAIFWISGVLSGNMVVACICMAVGGFFNGWSLIGAATLMQEHPAVAGQRSATATGMLFSFQRLGAVIFPLVYAAIMATTQSHTHSLMAIMCMLIVAFILFFLADETGKNAKKKLIAPKV